MFEVESCIRGFHVYGAVWKPRIGEILSYSREGDNREDPFAVLVQKSSATVGMCQGESRVSAHRGDSTLRHTGVHYAIL